MYIVSPTASVDKYIDCWIVCLNI